MEKCKRNKSDEKGSSKYEHIEMLPGRIVTATAISASVPPNVLNQQLEKFRVSKHSVRLSASNVGALTGFNPYSNIPDMIFSIVYQSRMGSLLLRRDAQLLGIDLVDEEDAMKALARKSESKEIVKAVEIAVEVKRQKKKIVSTNEATDLKASLTKLINNSKIKLNGADRKVLLSNSIQCVNTGFGTGHESDAIDLYEKECGWEVRERNSELMEWPFRRSTCDSKNLDGIKGNAEPISYASSSGHLRDSSKVVFGHYSCLFLLH